jgi:hypothetical protein
MITLCYPLTGNDHPNSRGGSRLIAWVTTLGNRIALTNATDRIAIPSAVGTAPLDPCGDGSPRLALSALSVGETGHASDGRRSRGRCTRIGGDSRFAALGISQ